MWKDPVTSVVSPSEHARASAAPLRLALESHEGRLAIKVVKRRGGDVVQPIVIDVNTARIDRGPLPDARTSKARDEKPRTIRFRTRARGVAQ